MSYVDETLLPGEQVTYRTKLHWIVFGLPGCVIIFGLLFVHGGSPLLVLIGVVMLVPAFLNRLTSEFAVTTKRVIMKVGVIRRRTLELQLAKVEALAVDQGILGRMLGYGNIVVTGTGGTREKFKRIEAPLQFRRAAQAATS